MKPHMVYGIGGFDVVDRTIGVQAADNGLVVEQRMMFARHPITRLVCVSIGYSMDPPHYVVVDDGRVTQRVEADKSHEHYATFKQCADFNNARRRARTMEVLRNLLVRLNAETA